MRESRFGRLVATLLIVALPGLLIPAQAETATATLSGMIISAKDRTPLAGAKVYAANPRTGAVYPSGLSGPDGSFEVRDLPAATYELGVQAGSGLYLVETPMSLGAGQAQQIHLAVSAGDDPDKPTPYPENVDDKHFPSIWSNPLTAALLVLGGAVVVGLLVESATDDSDSPASASAP